MSDLDAYKDEMGLLRHSDRDFDDLLTEGRVDGALGDLAGLFGDVRKTFVRGPSDAVEARHVAAMVAAVQQTPRPTRAARRRSLMRLKPLRLAAATLIIALLTGGLAAAGIVDLPVDVPGLPDHASDRAHEAVAANADEDAEGEGAPSPDQLPSDASETAHGVLTVIAANMEAVQSGELSGCEFGAMVSAAASDTEPDTSHCDNVGGIGDEKSAEGKAKGEAASAAGRARAEQAAPEGKAKGEEASAAGRARAEEARANGSGEGGKSTGEKASEAGKAKGEEASQAGRSKAEEASESGRATGEEGSESRRSAPDGRGKP